MQSKMGENKNIPQIRFNGFDESWEVKKLGEIGFTYSGLFGKSKIDFGHGEGKYITYMNIFSNPITNVDITAPIEIDINQNEVEFGDVFFTTSSETPEEVGMTSVWLGSGKNTYLNSFCFGYRLTEELDSYFIAYLLRSFNIRKKITYLAQGISRYNISKNKVMQICISRPKISEQYHIGSYFQNLDKLITLQQQKHDKLVTLKKAMLDKMFPKEGADVPEIRFKGFTEAWKERRLGEVMDVTSVKRIHQSNWTNTGIRFLRARDIVSTYKNEDPVEYLYISVEKYCEYSLISGKVKPGDLLVTGVGTIGVPLLIKNDNPVYFKDGNIIWFKNENAVDGNFFYYSFISNRIQRYVNESAGIGTVGTYTIESGKKTPLNLPDKKEQILLGTFFKQLDNLIIFHNYEIQKLKNIKKACLEKMFV